jgi:cell division protein FtsQ
VSALLRIVAWILALALVALPVVAVLNGFGAERWPLRTLRINDGLQRVDVAQLQATVLPHARRGFFAVRLDDARAAVAKLPWVEHAEVRKRWPDILEVQVIEHRPFARWGEDQLLSERGRLFPAAGVLVPKGLPRLDGPVARVGDVVALYNEARAMFASSGVDVRALRIDPRGSWSLALARPAAPAAVDVVLGRSDARPRLSRFARLLPQLQALEPGRTLQRADLRYTNGFALTWGDANTGNATAAPAAAGRSPQEGNT